MIPGAIKNRPKISLADYEALPESMRGLYQGNEYPEFIGQKMMDLDGRLYIDGKNFELVDGKRRHSIIAKCSGCHRLSIIYAKGKCKACTQRFLYRKQPTKRTKKISPTVASREFRRRWPINFVCALDSIKYDPASYPYSEEEVNQLISTMADERYAKDAEILLRHYRDGVQFTDIAEEQKVSKQAVHMLAQRHLRKFRKIWKSINKNMVGGVKQDAD